MRLKHDVMYHHGMGGPPQRPLQVRIVCLLIVDRRTNVLSFDQSIMEAIKCFCTFAFAPDAATKLN